MNEKIINQRWNLTRSKLKQFQTSYKKLNKRTQDKLQNIFKGYNITRDNLYKSISNIDKTRLEEKIEELKEKGLFKGYFEYKVISLMKGILTYKDLLTILIYATYIEEKSSLDSDIDSLYSTVALDCLNQGRRDLKKEEFSILPYAILNSFSLVLIDGINWNDYLDALILTNAQEIEKQGLIHLQQDYEVNVYSDVFQRTFDKQRNRLICVNEDKYSGALDKYATALGNHAYLEASEENQKVKFVSDHCENVTKMCEYMDGMTFNTREQNKFKRPIGTNKDNLTIEDIDIKGLVIGINQPPINQHFHWCHSCLVYQIDKTADELRKEIKITERQTYRNYKDITGEWLKTSQSTTHQNVEILDKIFSYKGTDYLIDRHNVKYEFRKGEKEFAEWLSNNSNKKITLLPKINYPEKIQTPDYLIENEYFDFKYTTGCSEQLIYHNIYDKKEQSSNFIIEINNDGLNTNDIYKQIENTYRRLNWVEK